MDIDNAAYKEFLYCRTEREKHLARLAALMVAEKENELYRKGITLPPAPDNFDNDTFLAWDDPRFDSPCRALRVIGVKCTDLPAEAWDTWKDADRSGDPEHVAEMLRGFGLDVMVVLSDD